MFAEIKDQTLAEALAGHPGASAAANDRQMMLGGVADDGLYICFINWDHDTQGLDLVDTGIRTVERAREVIEQEFATHYSAEILKYLGLSLHGSPPYRSLSSCRRNRS
jgi:hypothetical protein